MKISYLYLILFLLSGPLCAAPDTSQTGVACVRASVAAPQVRDDAKGNQSALCKATLEGKDGFDLIGQARYVPHKTKLKQGVMQVLWTGLQISVGKRPLTYFKTPLLSTFVSQTPQLKQGMRLQIDGDMNQIDVALSEIEQNKAQAQARGGRDNIVKDERHLDDLQGLSDQEMYARSGLQNQQRNNDGSNGSGAADSMLGRNSGAHAFDGSDLNHGSQTGASSASQDSRSGHATSPSSSHHASFARRSAPSMHRGLYSGSYDHSSHGQRAPTPVATNATPTHPGLGQTAGVGQNSHGMNAQGVSGVHSGQGFDSRSGQEGDHAGRDNTNRQHPDGGAYDSDPTRGRAYGQFNDDGSGTGDPDGYGSEASGRDPKAPGYQDTDYNFKSSKATDVTYEYLTEGCRPRVDFDAMRYIIQERVITRNRGKIIHESKCVDSKKVYKIERDFDACPDRVDTPKRQAFSCYKRYWIDPTTAQGLETQKNYLDLSCQEDTRRPHAFVEGPGNCRHFKDFRGNFAQRQVETWYVNRLGVPIIVEPCHPTGPQFKFVTTTQGCGFRHVFDKFYSIRLQRLIFNDSGIEHTVIGCHQSGHKLTHEFKRSGCEDQRCDKHVIPMGKRHINVDGVLQQIGEECEPYGSQVPLQATSEGCGQEFVHDFDSGRSYPMVRWYYMSRGKAKFVTQCQRGDQAYPHHHSNMTYKHDDFNLRSVPIYDVTIEVGGKIVSLGRFEGRDEAKFIAYKKITEAVGFYVGVGGRMYRRVDDTIMYTIDPSLKHNFEGYYDENRLKFDQMK